MPSIATELNRFAQQLNLDSDSDLELEQINKAFIHAIESTCKDNAGMAKEILKHTNGFYIQKDDTPKKGSQKNQSFLVCGICIDDPLVRSEVNLRREMIQYDLIGQGYNVDEIRIIPAKRGMKQRHPYIEEASKTQKRIEEGNKSDPPEKDNKVNPDKYLNEDQGKNLEIVKKVLCRVFREETESVIEKINAVTLDELSSKNANKYGRRIYYRLHFYSNDSGIRKRIEQNKRFILSVSHDFGLYVRYVGVHKAQRNMTDLKAFPKNAESSSYVYKSK